MLKKLMSLFGLGRKRARLVVRVIWGRGSCGALRAFDADGSEVLASPIAVAARSDEALARRHANPARDVMRPYGDPATGSYLLIALDRLADAPQALRDELGECQLLFEPSEGDAAKAEAGGRLLLALHGGRLGADNCLRASAGGLRVSNDDLVKLVGLLQKGEEWRLEIVEETPSMLPHMLSAEPAGMALDPPVPFSEPAKRAIERRGAPSSDDDSWRWRDDDWSSSRDRYSSSGAAVAAATGAVAGAAAAQSARAREEEHHELTAEEPAAEASSFAPLSEAGESSASETESAQSGTSY